MTVRDKDRKYRFEKAYAERSMYSADSEHYKELSEVIRLILKEYGNRCVGNRYSFRLYNGKYRTVVLEDNEAF